MLYAPEYCTHYRLIRACYCHIESMSGYFNGYLQRATTPLPATVSQALHTEPLDAIYITVITSACHTFAGPEASLIKNIWNFCALKFHCKFHIKELTAIIFHPKETLLIPAFALGTCIHIYLAGCSRSSSPPALITAPRRIFGHNFL